MASDLPAEFALIARHFRPLAGPGALDLQDDAAVLAPPPGRELVLTAGDASALAVTLNGAEARPLGKAGQVVTARLNPSNFKEYLSNR